MNPNQVEIQFASQLVTVKWIKELAKSKYGAKESDICRVFVTRKSVCDQDDFVVRADDCLRISLVRSGELVLYKHGSARTLLLTWDSPTDSEITTCTKCLT